LAFHQGIAPSKPVCESQESLVVYASGTFALHTRETQNSENHEQQAFKLDHPNLIKKLNPSKPDQIWHSDLTYIRLKHGFVYLAAVLDGFSRKIDGSAIGLFFDASLPLEALQKALISRNPKPGLIHHSDRGVQRPRPPGASWGQEVHEPC
jgi:transposase InsO family protein